MNRRERSEPTADELQAMAYVDGELGQQAAHEFERRLAGDSALALEVSELKALELIARQMAPPEPMDYEWDRLNKEPLQRASVGFGFALILIGTLGLSAWGCWEIAQSTELSTPLKALMLSIVGGFALLFLTVLRGRMRTFPLDPYTQIKR
ncbi:MAG: hypothetical protein ACI8TQ_003115 [Planctomycetota bacterium]|jgi:hypothetical protein